MVLRRPNVVVVLLKVPNDLHDFFFSSETFLSRFMRLTTALSCGLLS
jgi:hypothetical protein